MYELYNAFEPIIPIFIILFFMVVFITVIINRKSGYKLDNGKKLVRFISYIGLIMTLIGIFLVTLLPSSNPERMTQFVPFLSIVETWEQATWRAIVNSLLMNIILFIPFGFFLYVLIRKFTITILLTILFSLLIELLQYLMPIGRISNIDDVLLNAAGGIIGSAFGLLFVKLGIVYLIQGKGKGGNKR